MGQLLYGNFYTNEISKSSTAERLEIDNTPTEKVLTNAYGLARNVLQPVRNHFGVPFAPQSWYRCEMLEWVLCAKSYATWCRDCSYSQSSESWKLYYRIKQHPKGCAADIEIATVSNDDLFNFIKDNLQFDQLIREYAIPGKPYSGWVHVSWLHHGNRKQVKHIN